jgi:hypothetical protein
VCNSGCCSPTGGTFGDYTCFNRSDIVGGCPGNVADAGPGKTLAEYAAACDAKQASGCNGFNNNGYLKQCVRASCGAKIVTLADHPKLVSCIRSATPYEPPPCHPPGPPPSPQPYGGP